MTDNSQENSIVELYQHNPETGEIFGPEGKLYDFKFFPQKSSKHERGYFETSDGRKFIFRPINRNVLLMFIQRFEKKHKPKIPRKAYNIGEENGKTQYSFESDLNDAAYVQEMDEYNTYLGVTLAALQVSLGLGYKVPPATEWDSELLDLFEVSIDTDSPYFEHERKYLYIMGSITSDEGDCLLRLLQGMQMPTVEGIEIAEKRFPSISE